MKFTLLLLSFAASANAATMVTLDVWAGSVSGNPANTFTRLSTSGGFGPNGTRIGLASAASAAREIAGTSNAVMFTIPGPGVISLTYHLDNSVNAPFRPGIQGLYDASSGVATTATGVNSALSGFVGLTGVTAITSPTPSGTVPGPGADSTGAPAVLFTTTYTIAAGSTAIGKDVAVGFYSAWNGTGGYIFGREDGPNQVTLTYIPEPSSAALLGSLGVLALLRRRR